MMHRIPSRGEDSMMPAQSFAPRNESELLAECKGKEELFDPYRHARFKLRTENSPSLLLMMLMRRASSALHDSTWLCHHLSTNAQIVDSTASASYCAYKVTALRAAVKEFLHPDPPLLCQDFLYRREKLCERLIGQLCACNNPHQRHLALACCQSANCKLLVTCPLTSDHYTDTAR
jgi:hypothetical protein